VTQGFKRLKHGLVNLKTEENMRISKIIVPGAGERLAKALALSLLTVSAFLIAAVPTHADPLLLETGLYTGSVFLLLVVGLGIEILILKLFVKRPIVEIGAAVLLANAATGFIGFVGLLLVNLKGIPVLPPGPLALASAAVEIPLIIWILNRAPVRKIIPGVLVANAVTLIFSLIMLAPVSISPGEPDSSLDLEVTRGLVEVRNAIVEYYEINGHYPEGLIGGSGSLSSADPLIASGIINSYPANPYAPYLRSHKFNLKFLLSGLGAPTEQVGLDEPVTEWEVRWFRSLRADPRFGDPDGEMLCANGLSDTGATMTLAPTFYHMNGTDFIPGCFFYRSYDFDLDGLADDYILGAYGWPTGMGTVPFDIIDGSNGEISLCLDSHGQILAGVPDGNPEAVLALHIGGMTEQ